MNAIRDPKEIGERGRRIYHDSIQSVVETDENIGHYIAIDVNTGEYLVGGSYSDLNARLTIAETLRAKIPSALVYLGLIGYPATGAIGSTLRPNVPRKTTSE